MAQVIPEIAREIVRLRKAIKAVAWITFIVGVIYFTTFYLFHQNLGKGIIWLAVAFIFSGVRIVQPPERWLVETLGKYTRALRAGFNWTVPLIETIRARPRTWEQEVPIFTDKMEIDFRDGTVTPENPEVYVEIEEEDPSKAIYRVRDWPTWIKDNIDPLIRGYLNTLWTKEAIDEGMARGNLLDRINEAPDVTTKKLEEVRRKITELIQRGEEVNKPIIDELRRREEDLEIFLRNHERIKKDLEAFIPNAREEKGIKIRRVVVAEFGLSKDMIEARERVLEERREAEAALWKAAREATMRTEPIVRTRSELIKAGVKPEDAARLAIELEVVETLAEQKIWTAGLGQAIATAAPAVARAVVEAMRGPTSES